MKGVSASKAALLGACAYPFRDATVVVDTKGRSAIQGNDFHQRIARVVDDTVPAIDKAVTTKWLRERLLRASEWIAAHRERAWMLEEAEARLTALESAVAALKPIDVGDLNSEWANFVVLLRASEWIAAHRERAWMLEEAIWRAEVAYAYEPATDIGRILGYNIGREYEAHGLRPGELAGSADVEVLRGGIVDVYDWKTGRTIGAGAEAQLEWLALFAARATGRAHVRVVAVHVTETGVTETEWFHDEVSLRRIAEQMRIDVAAISDAWPTPGSHCENLYCGARTSCEPYALTQLHRKETAA